MNKYFNLIYSKLKDRYTIEIDDNYKFPGIASRQRWINILTGDIKSVILLLNQGVQIPFLAIVEKQDRAPVRLFDFEDIYKSKSQKVIYNNSFITSPFGGKSGEANIYFNYNFFGKLVPEFDYFKTYPLEDVIKTWEDYDINLSVWVSKISYAFNEVTLGIEPLRLVRKGIFFEHKIPEGSNKITTSFLARVIKLTIIISKALGYPSFIEGLYSNKLMFIKHYEEKIFTRALEFGLNIEYKSDYEIKDANARMEQMIEFLKNNDKFIEKAKNKDCLKDLDVL